MVDSVSSIVVFSFDGVGAHVRLAIVLLALLVIFPAVPAAQDESPVLMRALAVAQTDEGLVGSVAQISISQRPGSGLLFMDTRPFTQVDMQGSARLAVRVAGSVTGIDVSQRDFFFVVRSPSQLIGGPSAGGVMTVGAIAALMGWKVDPRVAMTGTIQADGSVGPVGGVPEKAQAAAQDGADLFLYPMGEDVTVTRTSRGWAQVNMKDHCAALGISCRAVVDVEEAVTAFTGMRFERETPVSSENALFRDAMRPLAQAQVEAAAELLASLRLQANQSEVAQAIAGQLESRLRSANESLEGARQAFTGKQYYAASSRSFASAILLEEARLLLEVARAEAPGAQIREELGSLDAEVTAATSLAQNASARGAGQWQALAAAQQRAAEAEERSEMASRICAGAVLLPCVEAVAYARERADTVQWWLDIGARLASAEPITDERQREWAIEAVAEAEQFLTYVRSTLGGSGGSATVLASAEAVLARARRDIADGLFAAAVYDAMDAQVRAGLTLEIMVFDDGIPPARVERSRSEAARSISLARHAGIEPVLAASQFEFAENLSAPAERLAFYDMARVVASSYSLFQPAEHVKRSSAFLGSPSPLPRPPVDSLRSGLVGATVGLVAGFVIGAWVIARQRSPSLQDSRRLEITLPEASRPAEGAGFSREVSAIWARSASTTTDRSPASFPAGGDGDGNALPLEREPTAGTRTDDEPPS